MSTRTYAPPRRRPEGPRPRQPRQPRPQPEPPKPSDPIWAKICVIAGALIAIAAGAAVVVPKAITAWVEHGLDQQNLIPDAVAGENIDGPINMLLLGMDERTGSDHLILSDTIIIAHIPASHDKIYLVSIPRDTEVDLPDYPPSNFTGWRTKINAAFAYGATHPDGSVDPSPEGRRKGAELMMLTINQLVPGGLKFNGAAIINFDGFLDVLKAIGGVRMCVDIETRSVHRNQAGEVRPGGQHWPYNQRKVYPVGCQDMQPWEALDFARQRYNLPGGDYARQRHQQQLIMAIVKKVTSRGVLTDLGAIVDLRNAAGDLLTLDLGPAPIEDWFLTLSSLRAKDLVMIKTNAGKSQPLGNGNERLTPETVELLQAVHDDTVVEFLSSHPDWIASAPNDPTESGPTEPAGGQ